MRGAIRLNKTAKRTKEEPSLPFAHEERGGCETIQASPRQSHTDISSGGGNEEKVSCGGLQTVLRFQKLRKEFEVWMGRD
jgi:hypothetical protein